MGTEYSLSQSQAKQSAVHSSEGVLSEGLAQSRLQSGQAERLALARENARLQKESPERPLLRPQEFARHIPAVPCARIAAHTHEDPEPHKLHHEVASTV